MKDIELFSQLACQPFPNRTQGTQWTVSLVITDCKFNLVRGLCGYARVNVHISHLLR